MQFTTQQDVEAPIAFVFQKVSDFTRFERQAMRRGADVQRRDSLPRPGVGMIWRITFAFRGKDRNLRAEITSFDPPNGFEIATKSGGITGQTRVDLIALSRGRTRIDLTTELAATTLPARLLLQSLKLARGNLSRRLDARVEGYAREIEEMHARRT